MASIIRRQFMSLGAASLLLPSVTAQVNAQNDLTVRIDSNWNSGGTDPYGGTHDEAMTDFGEFFPENAKDYFTNRAKANGGIGTQYYMEDIPEGTVFRRMKFGGKRSGSRARAIDNVAAYPSKWCCGASRGHRYWTWEGKNAQGERVTVGYSVPLVCGNSSALLYRAGAPVCVPIPRSGVKSV